MTTAPVKITRKGQITIPRKVREKLNADAIYFEVKDDVIILKPVRDVAGSLRQYAGKVEPGRSIKKIKDEAWEVSVREKAGKKSA